MLDCLPALPAAPMSHVSLTPTPVPVAGRTGPRPGY